MPELGENIRKTREKMGITQEELAKRLGYKSKSTINKIELGINDIPRSKVEGFALALDTTPETLMGWSTTPGYVKIPVLGYVAAGMPIHTYENIIEWEDIPEELAKNGEYFGLIINGASMEPRILKGDTVIVKKQSDVESGDIAIVIINGDQGTCKKVVKHEEGITLVSFNFDYPPMFYTWEDVNSLPIIINGKVVELRGKL